MGINLRAHGYAQGGSFDTSPCDIVVTLDTRGASFLFAACSGNAERPTNPAIDSFSDSLGNVWTRVPDFPAPGDGHSGNTCQSVYFWCVAPLTSATHDFTMHTIACGGLQGSLVVTAWTGIQQTAPFTGQAWESGLTATLPAVEGLALAALIIGYGDGNTGSNVGTVDGAWTIIEQAPSVTGGLMDRNPFVGLNLAYRLLPASATATATWTVPGTVVSGEGNGIFAFLGASTPAPVTQVLRRLRRFPLLYDRSFFIFLSRIEFAIQSGVGVESATAQGYDPMLQVRVSPDGGQTWGPWMTTPMGKLGDYLMRPTLSGIGSLRNGLCEVVITDPVFSYLLDCYLTIDEESGV